MRDASSRIGLNWLLALPALVLVGLFLLIPYGNIAVMSFRTSSTTAMYAPGFTVQNYLEVLGSQFYLNLLLKTLVYAAVTTAFTLVLAYPVAYYLARTQSRWRGLLYAGVLSPLLTGVIIRCFGWIVLLANNGIINQALGLVGIGPLSLMYNPFGVVIALVHVFLPYMIMPIMNSIQATDPRLEEVASTLGASQSRVFRRVILPMSLPGVQAGVILVFVMSASAYVIPMLLGGGQVQTMPIIIVQQLLGTAMWPFGAALALVLSLTVALSLVVFGMATIHAMRRLA